MQEKDLVHVASNSRYPLDAFIFVQRGLDYTVRNIHGEPLEEIDPDMLHNRHVTGEQLCTGLKEFAREQYGLMARSVLGRWRIVCCEDFGRIVFAMVEGGLMYKTDDDTIEDFTGLFDFDEAFSNELSFASES